MTICSSLLVVLQIEWKSKKNQPKSAGLLKELQLRILIAHWMFEEKRKWLSLGQKSKELT